MKLSETQKLIIDAASAQFTRETKMRRDEVILELSDEMQISHELVKRYFELCEAEQ